MESSGALKSRNFDGTMVWIDPFSGLKKQLRVTSSYRKPEDFQCVQNISFYAPRIMFEFFNINRFFLVQGFESFPEINPV